MSTLRERIASDAGRLFRESLLGVEAVYTATGASVSRTISVGFAPPYSQVDMFDGEATNTTPVAFVPETEVESPARGDTYLIDDVTYYAQKVIPNGIGLNIVTLSRQATHG